MKPEFEDLLSLAAGHRPDTAGVEYGFETRLLARLRGETVALDPSSAFLGQFSKLLWRSAAGISPLVVLLAFWLFFAMDVSVASASSDIADAIGELRHFVSVPTGLF